MDRSQPTPQERFYEALGFRADQHSSDERTVAIVVDDRIVVMLVTRDAFAELLTGEVGDPAQATTVVNCLSVVSRGDVDDLVAKAKVAGATTWSQGDEDPATHTGSLADPDDHVWRITYLEPVHVID